MSKGSINIEDIKPKELAKIIHDAYEEILVEKQHEAIEFKDLSPESKQIMIKVSKRVLEILDELY